MNRLSLNSEGAIQDIRRSTCLLVWLLSSDKDLVFSGWNEPLGVIEHHLLSCHNIRHLCMRTIKSYQLPRYSHVVM